MKLSFGNPILFSDIAPLMLLTSKQLPEINIFFYEQESNIFDMKLILVFKFLIDLSKEKSGIPSHAKWIKTSGLKFIISFM